MTWAGGELLSYTGGNPNDWTQNRSFAWTGGRNLQSIYQNDTLLALYNYDSDGLRVAKVTGTGTTLYYILDSQYQGQVSTINGQSYTVSYYWDEAGAPMGVKINGSAYFFVKNLQGDVVAITDYQGNVAARYTYDVWGKLLSVVNGAGNPVTDPTHVANLNPFRYRGYFYDAETGFYYLSSRYYDPEVGRFINADSYVSTGQGFSGNNMFIYCGDNPVNRVDLYGEMASVAGALAYGAAVGGANLWNPVGWIALGSTAVAAISIWVIPWDSVRQGLSKGWNQVESRARSVSVFRSLSLSVAKTKTKIRDEKERYDYWIALHVSYGSGGDTYLPTTPLSFSRAISYVHGGGDVFADSRKNAYKLAKAVGGGIPARDPAHGELGYWKHYHAIRGGKRIGGHIFYVS